jgi:UDP-N-acetylglucosamine 1-carboxyvinyltransferase
MCASLLTADRLTLKNIPVGLGDIKTLSAVLAYIGTDITCPDPKTMVLESREIKQAVAPYDLVSQMRASILTLGPLLARHHVAEVSLPGGCAIGTRPVDFHIEGLKAMGADIVVEGGYIKAKAEGGLKGGHYIFPKISHTGTENLMMAATLAQGQTILENCAREPEVEDLAECLIKMGAKISGAGTHTIIIDGVPTLYGATHNVIADRIEMGTWMIAVGMTGGALELHHARLDILSSLVPVLRSAGIKIEDQGDGVIIVSNDHPELLRGVDIMTEPYPGFPTDLQAQMMAMLSVCGGAGMVSETIFENRFMHVPELCRMGADIRVHGGSAIVRGVKNLSGAEVMATDLRASVALVLAGLVANGETIINRIYHLYRGYENIVDKLKSCGADIERLH